MVCGKVKRFSLGAAAIVAVAVLSAGITEAADWRQDWATLHNDRHGFLIAYPIQVFEPKADPATVSVRVELPGPAVLKVHLKLPEVSLFVSEPDTFVPFAPQLVATELTVS